MGFVDDVVKYKQNEIVKIKTAHELEKKVFDQLPNEISISDYWSFFESVRDFFAQICRNRLSIYGEQKEAKQNSYFYANVYDKLGENIEIAGDGNKNSTNKKLEIGKILFSSWPPNNSSTLKKDYRNKLKNIAKRFLLKTQGAYDDLLSLKLYLGNKFNQSNNKNSAIKNNKDSKKNNNNQSIRKSLLNFDELNGNLLPYMKGWQKKDLKKGLDPILKLLTNNNSENQDIEKAGTFKENLSQMQQSLCLGNNDKPVTSLKFLCLEWAQQV